MRKKFTICLQSHAKEGIGVVVLGVVSVSVFVQNLHANVLFPRSQDGIMSFSFFM